MNGFVVAAPHSGSGKTVVTLGLLRAFGDRGMAVAPAKAGPDYIDPAFHRAASGQVCVNLDPWAMRPSLLSALARDHGAGRVLVVEAMMGLFDGAADGTGSAADLATLLDMPVVLVIDASRMAQSVAALVAGYRDHRPEVRLAGAILNRVGSARHEAMLRRALGPTGVAVLGVVPGDRALALPERHLGLVQAGEHDALEAFIVHAGAVMAEGCDLSALAALPLRQAQDEGTGVAQDEGYLRDAKDKDRLPLIPPLGQRIAVARDIAFAFAYPHLLDGWRAAGAELRPFSPLADEAPDPAADSIFLPGGYPELHAGTLSAATGFRAGMTAARDRGALIYGECGGYMVLGEGVIDADGARHAMLGYLPVETSFAARRRHLGYRRLAPLDASPWPMALTAHEFHYATVLREGRGPALFAARDALGDDLGHYGRRVGTVAGSWCHVIDMADR
ncbi:MULTISPECIES: cobyrinate a,c-diamide synthase [unclassified Roseitalea]|uniref:cobyrinate a,c-diamide synthase n=1 Tax=unclassified Roseitalea TaxID=2639107 RepID=UPI00273FA24D|nr:MULTISPECIES: cobyrinate a,c-diamide synthase [unclassified Roseitalea]